MTALKSAAAVALALLVSSPLAAAAASGREVHRARPGSAHADSTVKPNPATRTPKKAPAIRLRIPADELKQVIFAYPTSGSDIRFML